MAWLFNGTVPIYLQIAEKLRADIVCGNYGMGEKLPSVRELAIDAAVNPNTVQRAFSELEHDGIIVTEGTSGRRVTTDEAAVSAAKRSLADKYAARFSEEMQKLGYSCEDAINTVITFYREVTDNGKCDS